MSANVRSMRLKYATPLTSTQTTAIVEIRITVGDPAEDPSSAQRKPSPTPAIGFNPYSVRHSGGTSLLEYTTGVANIQNWARKGMTYLKSRYLMFSAES